MKELPAALKNEYLGFPGQAWTCRRIKLGYNPGGLEHFPVSARDLRAVAPGLTVTVAHDHDHTHVHLFQGSVLSELDYLFFHFLKKPDIL